MGYDPKRKKESDKEIPTITSLLNRKKLKVKSSDDPLDRSKPMDLSELEREFAPQQEEAHPVIEGIDNWDTRGIARAVKHTECAKKTEEFKKIMKSQVKFEKTPQGFRRPERSISVKIKRAPQEPAGPVIIRNNEPAQLRTAPPPPRAPQAPQAPRTPRAPSAPIRTVPTAPLAPSTVTAAPPRAKSKARPPTTWTMEMLKGGPDPLGKGLSILLERGATTSLFLSISPPPPGAKIPHFAAAASAKPTPEKIAIWTGLKWDPATVPQVWNQLLKSGYVEFHPPGQVTNVTSRRNTIRGAFGLGADEILLLIRVGPVAACRGVLAIYSDRSLLMELGPILTLFNTPLPLQKAG